jgi:Mg2+ and Co2+ transporter CorA
LELFGLETLNRGLGEMFTRLGGSVRSELTAVESRERRQDEAERRAWGVRALSALGFFLVPATFFFGFFGMNAAEVPDTRSLWDLSSYWPAYTVTALLAVALTRPVSGAGRVR